MNLANNQPDFDLLSKYLAGEAEPAEAMQIEEWLSHPENKIEMERMMKLWNLLPGGAVYEVPSKRDAWSEIKPAIQPSQKQNQRRILTWLAAAAIIGIIALTVVFLIRNNKPVQEAKNNPPENLIHSAGQITQAVNLPDGSVVTMRRNTSLRYPPSFNNVVRTVALSGECYFEVAHDKSKPFTITIDKLSIVVIGTAFNVNPVADKGIIEVQVQSGTVKMMSGGKELIVTKGQTGIYHINTGGLVVKKEIDVNSFGYATKTFLFTDLSIEQVCRYLEKSFDVTIELNAQKLADCRITAQFENKPLDYILDVIGATVNTTYKKTGNHIYLDGKGCN